MADTVGNTKTSQSRVAPTERPRSIKEDRTAETSKEKVCDAEMSAVSGSNQHLDLPRVALTTMGLWLLALHLICQHPESELRGAPRLMLTRSHRVWAKH